MSTKVTPHFTYEEFVKSYTAERFGINNTLPDQLRPNMFKVLSTLEIAREIIDQPIYISSGYRCHQLNQAVNGSKNSYHLNARAVDVIPADNDLYNLFDVLNSLPHVEIIRHNTYIHFAV